MTTLIYICGACSIFWALFHCGFWKMFKWNTELKKLEQTNSAVMQVLNIQMIFCFLAAAAICFVFPGELAGTCLGHAFLLGCAGFWLLRSVMEVVYFRNKFLSTFTMTLFFLIQAALFALPVFMR